MGKIEAVPWNPLDWRFTVVSYTFFTYSSKSRGRIRPTNWTVNLDKYSYPGRSKSFFEPWLISEPSNIFTCILASLWKAMFVILSFCPRVAAHFSKTNEIRIKKYQNIMRQNEKNHDFDFFRHFSAIFMPHFTPLTPIYRDLKFSGSQKYVPKIITIWFGINISSTLAMA